ncbi:MAG: GNAT family N-acetyltransferase [Betaproteobacteria bacterium]|nr:GNAT family N-acetyltransferase [Betaproteobacteria bacterium]MDH5285607.1 GNAT family N-acetyltransferase [Betaproteobacteria bacterium]
MRDADDASRSASKHGHDQSVVLRTPSLVLRRLRLTDAPRIFELSREATLRERIPDQVYRDEREARGVLRHLVAQYAVADPRSAPYVLAIDLGTPNELVGHVGFSPLAGEVEIGYAIAMAHQGRGRATEGVGAAAQWALRTFALQSIVGVVAADNAASCKVLERCGFLLEREGERMLHRRPQSARLYRLAGG